MKSLYRYSNGNTEVEIFDDGTKHRVWEGEPKPIFPESMDVKITDYCDAGCSYCHEESTTKGLPSHIWQERYCKIFEDLPAGVEIAIGGGDPTSHPDLSDWLRFLSEKGKIANLTINHYHLGKQSWILEHWKDRGWLRGVGISYSHILDCKYGEDVLDRWLKQDDTVLHLIAGVNTPEQLFKLWKRSQKFGKTLKVLLLGYKTFGRGVNYGAKYSNEVAERIREWYVQLPHILAKPGILLSFDNLGISQLNPKRLLSKKDWDRMYMGDDGQFSMYLDLVAGKFCVSSTTPKEERMEIGDNSIQQMFATIQSTSAIPTRGEMAGGGSPISASAQAS